MPSGWVSPSGSLIHLRRVVKWTAGPRRGGHRRRLPPAPQAALPGLPHRPDRRLGQSPPGIIEGACRHIVRDRMDFTGARWWLPGAEAMRSGPETCDTELGQVMVRLQHGSSIDGRPPHHDSQLQVTESINECSGRYVTDLFYAGGLIPKTPLSPGGREPASAVPIWPAMSGEDLIHLLEHGLPSRAEHDRLEQFDRRRRSIRIRSSGWSARRRPAGGCWRGPCTGPGVSSLRPARCRALRGPWRRTRRHPR